MKTTVLPGHDDLLQRLREADPWSGPPELYPWIAKRLDDRELNGHGVVIGMQLAFRYYLSYLHDRVGLQKDVVRALTAQYDPQVANFVRAIVDDPEVQADALAMVRELEEERGSG